MVDITSLTKYESFVMHHVGTKVVSGEWTDEDSTNLWRFVDCRADRHEKRKAIVATLYAVLGAAADVAGGGVKPEA
tara:strand:- start:14388 stop:14615 length:228 start_codon:yes stop_codon:yes gene_type:complete